MYAKSILVAALAALAALTAASPIESRQTSGNSAYEFSQGGCRPILFAFTRGTMEAGNLVCSQLA
jgi:cutinase